jgi:hypothetical protein
MKKLLLILLLPMVLLLAGCWCSQTLEWLEKWVVVGRHDSASFNDSTYVIVELSNWEKTTSAGITLQIWDKVNCKLSSFFWDSCFLVNNNL